MKDGRLKSLGVNIFANVVGRAWMTLMSFVFVPVYLRVLGTEAFGVVGFFATLTALFSLLDLGISATLGREMARRSAVAEEAHTLPAVLRTLETIYWAIGLAVALGVVVAAPFVATRWLHVQHLPEQDVVNAIRLMGVAFAFQWPTGLYNGGLLGLQHQVAANIVNVAIATARGVGVVAVLYFVSPTLYAFFLWQVLVSLSGVIVMRIVLARAMPSGRDRARFDASLFRTLWRFAAQMTGITLVSLAIMQGDKVVVSAILPLSVYAQYVLAGALGSATGLVTPPISTAVYPRLTQLVGMGDRAGLVRVYHEACALISVALIPLVVTLAAFAPEVLAFWTRNPALAHATAPIASLLVIGAGLNGLITIPYMLQIANGSPRLTLIANVIGVLVCLPLLVVFGTRYGAIGAAVVWPLYNLANVLILAPLIHRQLLPGATRRWLVSDIGRPLLAATPPVLLARALTPAGLSLSQGLGVALLTGAISLTAALLAVARTRDMAGRLLRSFTAARRARVAADG